MRTDLTFLTPLVRRVLEDPHSEWTVQGFGFLRTYFGPPDAPKKFRLNLWDSDLTIPNVSTIHDHPWDFKSIIIAGSFYNKRYLLLSTKEWISGIVEPTHHHVTIKTGEGGGKRKITPKICRLKSLPIEHYAPGDTYEQRADEIHETIFEDGTITLNERIGDTEHARVFWPYGTDWVDAKPRKATQAEVNSAVTYSLKEWF